MTLHKCQFISEWEEGTVQTNGTYDDKTGEVTAESVDTEDMGFLEREYITYTNRKKQECECEVCTTCHSYIMKTEMNPGIGHDLNEEQVCSDPDCESNA